MASMYGNKEVVMDDFQYMFLDDEVHLCKRSTQYLKKWVVTCHKATRKQPADGKNVVADTPRRKKEEAEDGNGGGHITRGEKESAIIF